MGSLKNSTLLLLPAEPSDTAEIFEMHLAAFSSPPEAFFFVLFPQDEPREKTLKRMLDWWVGDPTAGYMKVVDSETGQIISAGSMLVKWGTDIADAMGVTAIIEGSVAAKKLYESHGFVASGDWIAVPVDERWRDRPLVGCFFYERPAKSEAAKEGWEKELERIDDFVKSKIEKKSV